MNKGLIVILVGIIGCVVGIGLHYLSQPYIESQTGLAKATYPALNEFASLLSFVGIVLALAGILYFIALFRGRLRREYGF